MATIKDIENLGYVVGVAQDYSDNPDVECNLVYRIKGFGISTMVQDVNQADIDSLADPVAHAERLKQFNEGPPVPPEPNLTSEQELANLINSATTDAAIIKSLKDWSAKHKTI